MTVSLFNGVSAFSGVSKEEGVSFFEGVSDHLAERYAFNFLSSGDYISTPSSAANSITGDITIIVEIAPNDWTPATVQTLTAKDSVSAAGRSYAFNIQTSGAPRLNFSIDGTAIISATSSAATGFADGSKWHLGVERESATGKVRFYTSPDHKTWTLLGVEQTATAGALFASSTAVQFGNLAALSFDFQGKMYASEIYTGLAISIPGGSVLKNEMAPNDYEAGTSWVARPTGETWTLNGNVKIF